MPWLSKWVAPELFFTYKDINIYYTYKDQEINNGPNVNWFTLDEEEDPENEFDVRDLSTYNALKTTQEIIEEAIDKGELKNAE